MEVQEYVICEEAFDLDTSNLPAGEEIGKWYKLTPKIP
jgi:hypothetical protein